MLLWDGFCCGTWGMDRCNWPGTLELFGPKNWLTCGFLETSGTKTEFVGATTGVGSRGGFIGGWSGESATFCLSTDTWFTGFNLPLPAGLCACSTLWSLSDCCSWAWRYSQYNASCWATEIETPGRVYWESNSRWFKLPAALHVFSGGLLGAVSWTRGSAVAEPGREKLNSLAAVNELTGGNEFTHSLTGLWLLSDPLSLNKLSSLEWWLNN